MKVNFFKANTPSVHVLNFIENIRKYTGFEFRSPKAAAAVKVPNVIGEYAYPVFIGIGSTLRPHRLCWQLNKQFDIDLVRTPELDTCVPAADGDNEYITAYRYTISGDCKYTLYKIKNSKGSVMQGIDQVDYVLAIEGYRAADTAMEMAKGIKLIDEVQMIMPIPASRLGELKRLVN